MISVHVTETEETGMCEIKITTEAGSFTFWDDKINVTGRISKELTGLGF